MTTWTIVTPQARGYIETEDNIFLLATENDELIQQENLTDIDTEDILLVTYDICI